MSEKSSRSILSIIYNAIIIFHLKKFLYFSHIFTLAWFCKLLYALHEEKNNSNGNFLKPEAGKCNANKKEDIVCIINMMSF